MNTIMINNFDTNNTENKKKTLPMTFRIEENIMNKLKDEAQSQDISINTLLNHILKKYVEWDVFMPKIGMIPVSKPIIIEVFKKLNDNDITDIAIVGKNTVMDMALFMKGRLNVQTFLSWYGARLKNSCIEVRHSEDMENEIYAIKHDLGINWSKYHKKLLELIFKEIFKQLIEIEISDTTLVFRTKNAYTSIT